MITYLLSILLLPVVFFKRVLILWIVVNFCGTKPQKSFEFWIGHINLFQNSIIESVVVPITAPCRPTAFHLELT